MHLATYNVNDVLKRFEPLRAWLDVTRPDVVCLQEIKCTTPDFPFEPLRRMGYESLVYGQKAWNGVAILAKGSKPIEIRRGLPDAPSDKEARYLEAAVEGLVVGCLYMPNGNPQPGLKFERKLEWFERFNRHAEALLRTGHPVVLAGDYNVVPTDADIYATRSLKDNALLQPEPRAAFRELLRAGWTDALHAQSPKKPIYTFWSYMRNRWARDAGMRIDHLLLSPAAAQRMESAGVDRDVRGLEGASDHAPAWVVLD